MGNNIQFSIILGADNTIRRYLPQLEEKYNFSSKDYIGHTVFGGHIELLFSSDLHIYKKISISKEEFY